MVLSYRRDEYEVPFTSNCIIHADEEKEVFDGAWITVTSSIFASVDFVSGAVKTSETFEVPIRTYSNEPVTVFDGQSATLNCSDNDIFNMYVTL